MPSQPNGERLSGVPPSAHLGAAGGLAAGPIKPATHPEEERMTDANSEWRLTGDTDEASFARAVRRSFVAGDSPLAAEAAEVHAALRRFGLSRLGAAFLWHETKNGSWNCSTAPQGSPCIPRSNRNPFAMKNPGGGWAVYDSYAEAAQEWAERLLSPNGPYARTGTLDELIRVYCPPGVDGNTEEGHRTYVATIAREVDALPEVTAAPAANPWPKPPIFSLAKDFARYGLTKRQADKILSHRFATRQGLGIRAIVLHSQEGTSSGSLSWWASGNADASSSVMIQKDGSILRVISDEFGPWTNGDTQRPSAKGQRLIDSIGGANPNLVTVSIEAEGYWQDDMPRAQAEAICWMVTEWMQRHGLGLSDVYRHADFNSVTRPNCPGRYFDVVMGMLKGGQPAPPPEPPKPADPWPGKPAWLGADLIPLLFPEAQPGGVRTQSWFNWCHRTGTAPARKAFVFKDTPNELILFEGGLMIDRAGRWVGHA